MTVWHTAPVLIAVLLAWLEFRRPSRAQLYSRIAAVLAAVAAITLLLLGRGRAGTVTLLTPGAPLAAHSRDAIALNQIQSVTTLAERRSAVRLVGWGLLAHEWPDTFHQLAGFDRAALPFGVTQLDLPTEVAVGERLPVRGAVTLNGADAAWVILEDPAGPRDSVRVTRASAGFSLSDRPRAAGPVDYRLRLRAPGLPEMAETLGVAVRELAPPAVLVLDASPNFETAYFKRWLGDRGARVTVRTAISRGRYRTERLNDKGGDIGYLTPALLERYDAVFADGGSLAGLSPGERRALDRQVREQGLGLLVTADAPGLLAWGTCGLLNGFALEPPAGGGEAATGDGADRRVARPGWPDAPRQSRTGIEAEAATFKPGGVESLIRDEAGRTVVASRRAGSGRVGLTLLRAPSRWILEGEPDLFAAYWQTLLLAVARDTATRISIAADGPVRADHPVTVTLLVPSSEFRAPTASHSSPPPEPRNSELGTPRVSVTSPTGVVDTVPLAQDPFDPIRWTGLYWPRSAGWHRLGLGADRSVPFRVSYPAEWTGLEASARLAASTPRFARGTGRRAPRDFALAWLQPALFTVLLLALSWLWIEARLGGGRGA